MTQPWAVRPETAADRAAVRRVVTEAFPTPAEADLVDALRADPAWLPGLSWVATGPGGEIAGHALLTRCRIAEPGGRAGDAVALAPVAVRPARQRTGAGTAVVGAALDAARRAGETLAVVLGDPAYYPRFGFVPASRFGVRAPFEVPADALMALPLRDGPVPAGTIRYPAPFGV
ncbi:GNAT family N-acetyltransferase [Actinomadura atramentaria]|uniref:GNAT family N-acetyltransferase n=1 Tax=Actinomadura atramentaria TaxID=1990 RepID=UPI0003633896|nr:N-acetyltransferase [Actinomadura atramentaria]